MLSDLICKWQCLYGVCVCVSAIAKTCFLVDWRFLVKERISNIGLPFNMLKVFFICWFFVIWLFCLFLKDLLVFATSVLCIIGDSVVWGLWLCLLVLITGDTRHATSNMSTFPSPLLHVLWASGCRLYVICELYNQSFSVLYTKLLL